MFHIPARTFDPDNVAVISNSLIYWAPECDENPDADSCGSNFGNCAVEIRF